MLFRSMLGAALGTRARPFKILLFCSACIPAAIAEDPPQLETSPLDTDTIESVIRDRFDQPVRTSTANEGAPGDVIIDTAGSIILGGRTGLAAITLDSDHAITNNGVISIADTDDVSGIRVLPGHHGDITIAGTINLLEDYERRDQDGDGDADGAYALGSDRFGLILEPGARHVGNLSIGPEAAINVEGNDSAGISLQAHLDGTYAQYGNLSVIGESSIGLDIHDGVSGDIFIDGNVAVVGARPHRG